MHTYIIADLFHSTVNICCVLMTETDTAAMDLTYMLSSLDSDAHYTVEVKAMNVGGVGNGTSTNVTTNKKGLLRSGLCTYTT